jgi:hypothetical protein
MVVGEGGERDKRMEEMRLSKKNTGDDHSVISLQAHHFLSGHHFHLLSCRHFMLPLLFMYVRLDDLFVIPNNLRAYLHSLDDEPFGPSEQQTKPMFLGRRFQVRSVVIDMIDLLCDHHDLCGLELVWMMVMHIKRGSLSMSTASLLPCIPFSFTPSFLKIPKGQFFNSGGAGYAMNRAALNLLIDHLEDKKVVVERERMTPAPPTSHLYLFF